MKIISYTDIRKMDSHRICNTIVSDEELQFIIKDNFNREGSMKAYNSITKGYCNEKNIMCEKQNVIGRSWWKCLGFNGICNCAYICEIARNIENLMFDMARKEEYNEGDDIPIIPILKILKKERKWVIHQYINLQEEFNIRQEELETYVNEVEPQTYTQMKRSGDFTHNDEMKDNMMRMADKLRNAVIDLIKFSKIYRNPTKWGDYFEVDLYPTTRYIISYINENGEEVYNLGCMKYEPSTFHKIPMFQKKMKKILNAEAEKYISIMKDGLKNVLKTPCFKKEDIKDDFKNYEEHNTIKNERFKRRTDE